MNEEVELRRFGLVRCSRCWRIVIARRLKNGLCREATECILLAQKRWLDERDRPLIAEEEVSNEGVE